MNVTSSIWPKKISNPQPRNPTDMAALPPKNQIPVSWLKDHAARLQRLLRPFLQDHHERTLSDAEFVAVFVLLFNRLWRREWWTAGQLQEEMPFASSQLTVAALSRKTGI